MEIQFYLTEQLIQNDGSEALEKVPIKSKCHDEIVPEAMLEKEKIDQRKIGEYRNDKSAEWSETGNACEHESMKAKNLEKQGSLENSSSSLTKAKGLMDEEDQRMQFDFFSTELQELIVENASQSEGKDETFSQLDFLKPGEKLPSLYEATEQEEPFIHNGMQHCRFLNCLRLSLKFSQSPSMHEEMSCTSNEGKRFIHFTNNSEGKENLVVNRPVFVPRPCSIPSLTRLECHNELGNQKVGSSMSRQKIFEGSDDTESPRNVTVEDSNVQMSLTFESKNPQRHGAACSYECMPKLEKSEEVDSVTEVDEPGKIKGERGMLNAFSRNSGYAALDLLVRAIQVTTGYLLEEEDNEFSENLQEEDVYRTSLCDPPLLARESTNIVVRKRVLRRAKSAFKKSIVQGSVIYATPKNGRKSLTLNQGVGNDGIKVKLSDSGTQSAHEKKGPLTRSKNGRSQMLPAKFCDSVLQPWKGKSRRQLKMTQKI